MSTVAKRVVGREVAKRRRQSRMQSLERSTARRSGSVDWVEISAIDSSALRASIKSRENVDDPQPMSMMRGRVLKSG